MSNLKGSLPESKNNDDRQPQLVINSLDFAVVPDRLPVFRSTARGVFLYGADNNYPRKIIQSSERCSNLEAVKKKQFEFVAGNGFPGATANDVKNDTAVVINKQGQTLYDMLQFCSQQKANINWAIHVNYNALGEAVEFNFIEYDFVRRKIPIEGEKFDRYIITNIWHLENDYSGEMFASKIQEFNSWVKDKKENINFTALECFDYNPDPLIVREQIELTGGIDKYPGQLFYAKRTNGIYQKAVYDSLSDKFQFLAECDLSSLSNVQNGYAGSGVLKYFTAADGKKEIEEIVKKVTNIKGASNTGRFFTIPMLPNADMRMPTNIFESTEIQNRDKLYTEQKKEAKEGIQEIYGTPNSVLGNESKGNLAIQDYENGFDAYNSVTQCLRTETEIEFTILLKNSIFASQVKLPVEIEPLKFISTRKEEITTKTESNEDINDN